MNDADRADASGKQVVLSSSLENKSFGLTGIQYFNAVVQVRCIPFWTSYILTNPVFPGFDHHLLLRHVDGEQAESVCPEFP